MASFSSRRRQQIQSSRRSTDLPEARLADKIEILGKEENGRRLIGMNNQQKGSQEKPEQRDGIASWKRALDLSIIVLLSPVLLVIGGLVALIIKSGSEGPLFFRQRRVGYKGRQFTCYKFRTMRTDAETESHRLHTQRLIHSKDPMVKLDAKRDPRLIPLGSLLRAGGLDELPQMLNVLRREMSLVGPRPCIPYEYELYEPWHCRRFEATPGLTGLWQVSGKNRTTFDEMVALDIDYAERRTLWLDIRIIFRTLPALWRQYNDLQETKRLTPTPAVSALRKSAESFHL
jgi:lipopolysaccharide/colanic/teichoic acid biosynthesis glycosyltransferase